MIQPFFRILIVDDEAFVRSTVKRMLHIIGSFDVQDVGGGSAALDLVGAFKPDLVLCDIHMEPMSGLEFVRQLRTLKDGSAARTRVVMLTGNAKPSSVANAMQLGISGYVVKPVSVTQLRKHIEPILAELAPTTL